MRGEREKRQQGKIDGFVILFCFFRGGGCQIDLIVTLVIPVRMNRSTYVQT